MLNYSLKLILALLVFLTAISCNRTTSGPYSSYFKMKLEAHDDFTNLAGAENFFINYILTLKNDIKGKDVLDIGTGSGILGFYFASLCAKKVVATDIAPTAISSTINNAKKLNFSDIVEARLVSIEDTSPYSVIKSDEKFDYIISNAADILYFENATDTGHFLLQIIDGAKQYLRANGKLILRVRSFFAHHLAVQYLKSKKINFINCYPETVHPSEFRSVIDLTFKRLEQTAGINSKELTPLDIDFISKFKIRYKEECKGDLEDGLIVISPTSNQ